MRTPPTWNVAALALEEQRDAGIEPCLGLAINPVLPLISFFLRPPRRGG